MTIGERLKKEREKKGLSIDEIHSRLRIHPNILSNLEENRFERLPAAIYTKGFLKRYGELLELNTQEMLSEYDSLNIEPKRLSLWIGNDDPAAKPHGHLSVQNPKIVSENIKLLLLRAFLVGGAITVFGVLVGGGLAYWKRQPMPVAGSGSRDLRAGIETKAPSLGTPGRLIASSVLGNFPKLRPKDPLQLRLKAQNDVWTRVFVDGEKVFESILKPGQMKTWTASRNFELKLGRPAAVLLDLNGFPLGSPGQGQAKHILIQHDGLRELY